ALRGLDFSYRHGSGSVGHDLLFRLSALCLALVLASAAKGQTADQPTKVNYPVVSEMACPANVVSIPGKGRNPVTAVIRQPPGTGPFPAVLLLHGGLSPYSVEKLKEESLTRPNYTRFLASGFVIVAPTFRSREENPQNRDALDDCLAV